MEVSKVKGEKKSKPWHCKNAGGVDSQGMLHNTYQQEERLGHPKNEWDERPFMSLHQLSKVLSVWVEREKMFTAERERASAILFLHIHL